MRLLPILAGAAALAALVSCGPVTINPGGPVTRPTQTTTPVTTGDQVIDLMYRRYSSQWYRTLSFVQKSTYYRPDGSFLRAETWYETANFPGRLRIDLGEPSRGNGVLYRADSTYSIQAGRITQRTAARNLLLTLGFDVYTQSPRITQAQIAAEGINMRVMRSDLFDGRRVYVVGAPSGDSTTNQFWIDAERMLFVRLIQTQGGRTRDIRFENYRQYGNAWLSETVRVLAGGVQVFTEEYSDIRINPDLENNYFIPEYWSAVNHWRKP